MLFIPRFFFLHFVYCTAVPRFHMSSCVRTCVYARYIRCVKPNPDKQSSRFDGEDVLLQLQYSGTMETIRIRQQVCILYVYVHMIMDTNAI